MKNYLITEDQLKKIVDELEDQNDEVSDEKDYNPISSLLNTKKLHDINQINFRN